MSGVPKGRAKAKLSRGSLGGFDLEDLELEGAARRCDLDRLALFLTEDRLADRRLVRELVLGRIRFGGTDEVVLDRLLRVDIAQPNLRADRHDVLGDLPLLDHPRAGEPLLELRDP